ncbi:MAG: peptidase MA family metallohydrolase [bacterium]|jgi:hypothetical protein|nr:peptidase MA family metallohydrolase [Bacillota bacterium]HHW56034.1 hypothetical protein [Bacillota bacterium]
MEVCPGRAQEEKRILRWVGLCLLALILISFWAHFPTLPRAVTYELAREISRSRLLQALAGWERLENGQFTVYYRPEDTGAGWLVLDTAAAIYQPVVELLKYKPPAATAIVVHPTQEGLAETFGWTAQDSGAMGVYWAGVIQLLSPNSWLPSDNPVRQSQLFLENGPVAHEFAHVVVDYKARGNYPRWLSEGIAQYVEYKINGVLWTGQGSSFDQALYSLEELADFSGLENQNLAYRQALSLVLYMAEVHGEEKLPQILTQLGRGATLDSALKKALGLTLAELEREWHSWIEGDLDRWL